MPTGRWKHQFIKHEDPGTGMKIYGPDNHELMSVTSLAQDGNDLVIHGKIFGTMQLSARIRPEEARAALKLLTPRTLWLLLTLMFRRGRS